MTGATKENASAETKRKITPDQIKEFLKAKGMAEKDLAEMLNVSELTVKRWLQNDGPDPTGTAAAILAALLATSGTLAAGPAGVASATGLGAAVGVIAGPAGIAVGAATGALVGLAVSGLKLFKKMDSSLKDDPDQIIKKLEHWAKAQEQLQAEIKRREALAKELKEAEQRIKDLEEELRRKEAATRGEEKT